MMLALLSTLRVNRARSPRLRWKTFGDALVRKFTNFCFYFAVSVNASLYESDSSIRNTPLFVRH